MHMDQLKINKSCSDHKPTVNRKASFFSGKIYFVEVINLLNPTGYVMQHQFNIQQLYALPTLYLCVLYLSQNKQRLVPLTAETDWFL